MNQRITGLLALLLSSIFALSWVCGAADPQDAEGSKDPALFSRMPGFHIYNYRELEFDRHEFATGPGQTGMVEGRYYYVNYYANEGITLPGALQIVRNYANAAKAIGGRVVYEYEDGGNWYTTLQVTRGQAEVWVAVVAAGNGMYTVEIIEKQLMNQEVTANAGSLAGSIRDTGKAAVYGIYFDTGQSEIKPESEAAIGEIAKMLKADGGLKLYVVGHTDNTGGFDSNLKLSQARAAAVAGALINRYGIAAARLIPFGAGPVMPVASNGSEEGRARNRRVELVAQ